jgi:DNA repair photolyase
MEAIQFGIRKDLQADIRHEPNACDGYVLDLSLGCSHRCIYCIFSPLEKKVYRLFDPGYRGQMIPLKLDRFMAKESFPPIVYMCYASDPLAGPEMIESTKLVLKKLFAHNVSVFFITKGIFPDDVLDVIALRPDLMEIQVGLTNRNEKRNKLIEPGVPSYEKRLNNFTKLSQIPKLGSLVARMDPLFPVIDDDPENMAAILDDLSGLGVKEAVFGYVILTEDLREKLKTISYLKESMEKLSEKTPTISTRPLYSFPFNEKVRKFEMFDTLCLKYGINMAACGCKDERLKSLDMEWVCHPFRRKNSRWGYTARELTDTQKLLVG